MSEIRTKRGRAERRNDSERVWRLLATGVVVAALVLLVVFGGLGFGLSGLGGSTASAGRSFEAAVRRSPGRGGPPSLAPGWRHTPVNAVIFYGGYFCAAGPGGRRARLVLALPELDTLTQGSTRVVGPFASKPQTRGAC